MSSARRNYARFVRKYYDRSARPIWPPNGPPVKLGDYGNVVDDILIPEGNISDNFGISISKIDDPYPASVTLSATQELSVKVKASGEVSADFPGVPKAEVRMSFESKRSGAFLFAAEKAFAPRIGNLGEVGSAIKSLDRWDSGWRVVTSLLMVPFCRIFVSLSKQGKIELKFDGDISPSIAELGKASVSVEAINETNNVVEFKAENITPFLQLHRLKRRFFGFGGGFRPHALTFPEVSYEFELDEDIEISPDEAALYDIM